MLQRLPVPRWLHQFEDGTVRITGSLTEDITVVIDRFTLRIPAGPLRVSLVFRGGSQAFVSKLYVDAADMIWVDTDRNVEGSAWRWQDGLAFINDTPLGRVVVGGAANLFAKAFAKGGLAHRSELSQGFNRGRLIKILVNGEQGFLDGWRNATEGSALFLKVPPLVANESSEEKEQGGAGDKPRVLTLLSVFVEESAEGFLHSCRGGKKGLFHF